MRIDVDMSDPEVREAVREAIKAGTVTLERGDFDPESPCLYLLAPHNGKPVKCGITKELRKRHRAIEAASGRRLRVYFSWTCADMNEARRLEKAAHSAIGAAHRLPGEWFAVSVSRAIAAIREIL